MKYVFGLLLTALTPIWAGTISNENTLEGQWLSACKNGKISQMRIDQNLNSYLREIFYQEPFCQTPQFYIETVGSVSFPEDAVQTLNPTFHSVDYLYKEILLTPLSPGMAAHFKNKQLCGLIEWVPLIATPISGKACAFVEGARPVKVPQTGHARYGIYSVSEPWLFFGQNNPIEDSSSPARRPSELQKEPFGKRFP